MNIKELTYYIQSANINFLIGSGASRPYLATLGSIEKLLTRLNDDMHSHPEPKYKIAEASIYKAFYDSVIAPNRFFGYGSDYCETKSNYQNISNSIGQILFKRGDVRDFYNKPDVPVSVPEVGSAGQLSLW